MHGMFYVAFLGFRVETVSKYLYLHKIVIKTRMLYGQNVKKSSTNFIINDCKKYITKKHINIISITWRT